AGVSPRLYDAAEGAAIKGSGKMNSITSEMDLNMEALDVLEAPELDTEYWIGFGVGLATGVAVGIIIAT
ncbi:MAG TPA: hypothetical protein VF619_01790, partial [Allosphingosinicella sp.]